MVAHLRRTAGDSLRITRHQDTGRLRFLGTTTGRPLESSRRNRSLPSETVARTFLGRYAGLFNASALPAELSLIKSRRLPSGASAVRFQQLAGGVPVIGGEFVVSLDRRNNVVSASGETTPRTALPTTAAKIPAARASATAIGVVARDMRLAAGSFTASAPALRVYDPALLGVPGTAAPSLVWQVSVRGPRETHRQVYVDATRGYIRLNFDPDPKAKQRVVCDREGERSGSDLCRAPYDIVEGGSTASASADALNAYLYAGDTYDYFKSRFGRDSLDDKGMQIRSTVGYCPEESESSALAPCPFPNAYWNGEQIVYGEGFASADDVVGHELMHGVTQYEANLFSLYQAGAINESISDIFGELIDQYNASIRTRGRDTTGEGGTVDYRWLIFEDGPVALGRDMKNPPSHKEPDRIRSGYYSAENEWSPLWDNGGVHINSGVGNKAAYLMAVGGSFNLRTIDPAAALGNEKLGQLYYRALTQHLTSGSDYADLADALQQSCAELVAEGPLAVAGQTLTFGTGDCDTVRIAVDATEMYLQPIVRLRGRGATVPTGATNPEALICDPGTQPSYLFYDNLEHPKVGNWVKTRRIGERDWAYPQNPNPFEVDLEYAKSGRKHMFADDPEFKADFSITTTRTVVPTPTTYLRFDHSHVFDFNYDTNLGVDSGVVEYSLDGKTFTRLTPESGQDYGPIAPLTVGNNSAVQGRGFVGDSHGYVSSRFFLGALAGQPVKIRFRMATDSRFGDFGWFVDDVRVYDCAAANVAPAGPPQAPVVTTIQPVEDGVAVIWSGTTAPAGVAGYLVTARSAGGLTVSVEVPTQTFGVTLRGLSSALSYVVTVRARSAFGDALSAVSAPVIPVDLSPPAVPTAVRIAPGVGAAVVTWKRDPVSFDNGARVVVKAGRTRPVNASDGRVVDVAGGTSARIAGLRDATAYSFAVFARGASGLLGTTGGTAIVEGTRVRLTVTPTSVVRGKDVVVSGGITTTRGVGAGRQSVDLYYRPTGSDRWVLFDGAFTGAGGLFDFRTGLPSTGDLQMRFRGGPGLLGSQSPVVRVVLRPAPLPPLRPGATVQAKPDNTFSPTDVRIKVGGSVTFVNAGGFHSVVGGTPDRIDIDSPVGVTMLESDGSRATVSFDEAGVYPYFCQPHSAIGMVGRVTVT